MKGFINSPKHSFFTLLLCVIAIPIFSQININNPFEDRAFTENSGQWNKEEKETNRTIYAGAYLQGKQVFITNKGIVYRYLKFHNKQKGFIEKWLEQRKNRIKISKTNEAGEEDEDEFYKNGNYIPQYVYVNFEKCNFSSKIIKDLKTKSFTSYSDPDNLAKNIKAFGYQKISLSNIYPDIDIEFTIKEKGGFEYSFIVKPNANTNSIQISYNGIDNISVSQNNELNLNIDEYNKLTESKPIAFEKETSNNVQCLRVLKNSTQFFKLASYNKNKTLIIDPVVFDPTLTSYNRVYDISKDDNGNIFVFGGLCPYVLKKFDNTGALLWSFDWSTQPNTATLYGDFAIDKTGNIIMVQGYPSGRIIKLDPLGTTIYNVIIPGTTTATELWRIAYNCDFSVLRLSGLVDVNGVYKQIVNIDPANGNLVSSSPTAVDESRALYIDPNGEIYSLTPTQGFSPNPSTNYFTKFDVSLNSLYRVVSGYNTAEASGIYHNVTYAGGTAKYSSMNGLAADINNVYTYDGNTIFKRRQSNGASVGSVTITNGITLANSGILMDPCFNLYVGTQNSVIQLDTNLNIISSQAVTAEVYDLCLYNGNVLATGNGFVKELNFNTNCKLSIITSTIANTKCESPYNGQASVSTPTNGTAPYTYLWDNGSTSQTAINLTPGKHWVLVKDAFCGNSKFTIDTIFIPDAPVLPIPSFTNNTACVGGVTTFTNLSTPLTGPNAITNWLWDFDNDGNMDDFSKNPNYTFPTAGTYTTNLYAIVIGTGCSANLTQTVQVLNLPSLSVFQLTPPACSAASRTLIASGATNYTWSPSIGISSTTGSVITSNPSSTSVYQLIGELSGCSNTITTTVVLNTTISAVTSQTDVSCYSLSDGSAEVQPSGGLGTYYYTWYGAATTQTTQSISGLIAGNYSVVITNTACSASGNELVINGDFESGNNSFTSDYNYTNPTNTAASEYNVGNASVAFQWNSNFSSAGDHTTGNGNMLLVNGSGTPGSNVFCQTLPVNPNSNYNFSTWVSSLNNASPALLQFYVNGIALGPMFTAPSTTNNWVQFFEVWNSGASTTANICIVNQNTTLGGNDFAIDDVSFQECLTPCPVTKTITITEPPLINIAVSSVSICLGSSGILTASGATTYTWNNATGLNTTIGATVVASPTITSSYTVTGSTPNGCSNVATTTVVVNPIPSVYAINTNSKCDTTKIDWMSFNNVTSNNGTGSVGGYSINVTQTNAGLFSHSGMYGVGNFPTQYSVASIATTLANNQAGLFTFCFNEEVINPQICLSSIGQGGLQVPVNTSAPYEVVWAGINMQYPTTTQFIGEEGYTIIKFPGRHTCISFDYLVTENYCTIGFGLLDVSCQKDTICPNDAVAFLAKGANTYLWSNGATTNTVLVYPTATSLYTVTGSNNYGCTNSTVIGVEVYTINPVIVNSPSICIGQQTATLTASGAITYTWNNSATLSSPTGSIVLANPNSSTNYTIGGTDKNACVITTTTNVHVFPLPNITVSSSTICIGNSASLNASGANTYTWSPTATLNSTNGATVISTTTVNTTYTVTATDINTCVNSNTTNVVVNSLPIITVTSNTICIGQAGALSVNGASTYTWANASSLSSSNGSSVTANPIVTTNYTVTGTDLNNCAKTETTSVTVNNLPIVNVTPSFSMCSSNTGTLTATGADAYTWSPSITLSSSTGSVVNTNQTAIQTYTVIGKNTITTCTNSAVTTISITTTPTVIAIANPSLICPQQSSTLTASGASNYIWLPFFTLGNSVIASPTVNTTYTVIGANGSCTNTALVAVSVTVNPTISVTTETICSGNSASLTASGGSSYSWTPGTYLSSTTGNAITSNAPSTKTYLVTGISPLGCKTTVSVEVTVVTTPTINVVGNPLTICTGSNSILTVNGANSYTWSPSATLDNANNSNVTATPISTTIYSVTGENNSGNISCYHSKTIQIIVKPKIVPILSPNQEMCEGQSTKIYAKGGNVYQWQPSNQVSEPNDSITVVKPNVTTIFTVSVSYNNLCPETGTVEVIVNPLPIIDAGKDSTINIDESIVLQGTGDVPVGFLSTASNPLVCNYCPIVEVFPKENTCYTLEGYSNKGCRAQDVVCITITKDWDIYIPNAFTPNGDSFNELFLPQGYGITQIDLQIFDRWGNMMFYEKDTKTGWDGKNKGLLCEQGVYVYKVFIYAMSGEAYSKTGHVTLLGKSK